MRDLCMPEDTFSLDATQIFLLRMNNILLLYIFSILCILMFAMLLIIRDLIQERSDMTVDQHPFVVKLAETMILTRPSNSTPTNPVAAHNETLEIRHIGFLKVHKAGSSTMQNIFFRFGLKRNLTFVIPKSGNYFTGIRSIVPLRPGNHHDILAVHCVYRKEEFDKVLPPNKVNIAIVREPLQRMISAAYYYRDVFGEGYLKRVPSGNFIKELIMHSEKYERGSFSHTKNSMGKDFGFDPSTKEADTNKILEKLKFLDKEFKLVLVMERFEESLVLLKRYLNWKLSDILFFQSNSHKHAEVNLTEEETRKHKNKCFLDYAIYDFFTKLFEYKVEAEGPDFKDEVRHFETILKQVRSFCDHSKAPTDQLKVQATAWNDNFIVSKSDCDLMKLGEIKFINNLRTRHILMNGRR